MQRAYIEYHPQGFVILAVNATYQDDVSKALNFAEQWNLTFPILFDHDGTVSRLYNVRALPTSYFIDRHGVITEVVIGGPMSEALLRIRMDELISGSSIENQ